ncbi:hypothetical protein SEA_GUYFAGIERI_6 [Rhodococcus phage GuyFagieri]|nr:hypothetical protein SEA_GUYFAGIERI_6 [Rhodococcus phage GuyFagieri]
MRYAYHPDRSAVICDHCGRGRPTMARLTRQGVHSDLCHPDGAANPVDTIRGTATADPDCYRLVTVYGETIGSRKK